MESCYRRALRRNRYECMYLDYRTMATALIQVQTLREEDHMWIKERSTDNEDRMDELLSIFHIRVTQRGFDAFVGVARAFAPALAALLEYDAYSPAGVHNSANLFGTYINPSTLQFRGPLSFRAVHELSFVLKYSFTFSISEVEVRHVSNTNYRGCSVLVQQVDNGPHYCSKFVDPSRDSNTGRWTYTCSLGHQMHNFVFVPFLHVAFQDPSGYIFYLSMFGYVVRKFLNMRLPEFASASPAQQALVMAATKGIKWNLDEVLCHQASECLPYVWVNHVRDLSPCVPPYPRYN